MKGAVLYGRMHNAPKRGAKKPNKPKNGAKKGKNGLFLMIFDKKLHFLQK